VTCWARLERVSYRLPRYGLIHPIVVDERKVLIAGGRRLAAATSLGWTLIDARIFDWLSDDEKRAIELEENLRRKDLTTYELSRQMVQDAETIAPALAAISTESVEKDPRGRKSQYAVPKQDVANALGVGKMTLVAAEQHVAAAERYPELKHALYPQDAAITIAKNLDKLPEPEREDKRAKLRNFDQTTVAIS
jgi:ParB-like chromosome segregation protein Spo0J